MCFAKTKALCKEDALPLAKSSASSKGLMLNGFTLVEKEMTDDLIANGQVNTTHFLLLHNPNGLSNGETNKETIQPKKVGIAIAQVMIHNCRIF